MSADEIRTRAKLHLELGVGLLVGFLVGSWLYAATAYAVVRVL